MKLSFIEMCGFRGYKKAVRINFSEGFTIVDGRNGAGKSTVFDALEFALTGTLGKYENSKADGETVADYIWWAGEGKAPEERYVEVGFHDESRDITVRREQVGQPDAKTLGSFVEMLCDERIAPSDPLSQLCQHTIIRDEYITSLSLDLRETDRYARLRAALGASDADVWINRAAELWSQAKARTKLAQQEVATANRDTGLSSRRLDEVRAKILEEQSVAAAIGRLQGFCGTNAPPDSVAGPARERIATVEEEISALEQLRQQIQASDQAHRHIVSLASSIETAKAENEAALAALSKLGSTSPGVSQTSLAEEATALISLVSLGRTLGLSDGHCPLCRTKQSLEAFERGMESAEELARKINLEAVKASEAERSFRAASTRVARAAEALAAIDETHRQAQSIVAAAEQLAMSLGYVASFSDDEIAERINVLRQSVISAQRDLRILDTLKFNADFERALKADAEIKVRLEKAQDRLTVALRTESNAQAFHDASRRAASETLDIRLDRVLPLMSELYRRLRPHPIWDDIEYSIRGDLRRFLTLQVGDELNPQFIFSSGQRRATGLAFLLSVNLSLAWSNLRSILLDDPVQHVDDFRTVHLAELCAQLVTGGRQIICAVEDAALADLFCRRLPVSAVGEGKRISLGQDIDGAIVIAAERPLQPPLRHSLVLQGGHSAAG